MLRYLAVQRPQGFWRVYLHLEHRGHASGNSYSGSTDHLQPPISMAALATTVLLPLWPWTIVPAALWGGLLLLQIPMSVRLASRIGPVRAGAFAVMSALRAVWRRVGMTAGTLAWAFGRHRRATDG